jgi:hypothetical protein
MLLLGSAPWKAHLRSLTLIVAARFVDFRKAGFLLMSMAIVGCIRSVHAPYPSTWSPDKKQAANEHDQPANCPNIAGRYEADGELNPDTPTKICSYDRVRSHEPLDWACDTSLASNLTSVYRDPRVADEGWVEIQQPDADTLRVTFGESSDEPIELRRSKGDFDCDSNELTRVQHDIWRAAPDARFERMYGPETTPARIFNSAFAAFNIVFGLAGVITLTRRFEDRAAGSLIMKITGSRRGLTFGIPTSQTYSTFVRWQRSQSPGESEEP